MLIAKIDKNTKERIHVALVEYHGHQLIDVRVHFRDDQGEWHPTKKGISLSPDTIDQVIEALKKGSAALEDALSPLPKGRKPKPSTIQAPDDSGTGTVPVDTISERVRAWVWSINGSQFSVKESQRALRLTGTKEKHLCNVILAQLAREGIIERTGTGRGIYRRMNHGSE